MRQLSITSLLLVCLILNSFFSFSQTAPLLNAIKNNNITEGAALLKNGADISVVDDDSDNVLMYAALYASYDYMKLLLQKGADPNAKNKLRETAIMWCTHDINKTQLLLDHKAEVNIRTTTGNTVLLSACVGQAQTAMIKLLLQHNADPLVINNRKETSLMLAALYGDTALARLLVNKGVDINTKGNEKFTAIYYATKSGNTDMVNWLVANGADVNVKDVYNATPLSYAVITGDMKMINVLLDKTTGINEQDIDGMTILMWAIYNEYDKPAVVQALLDKGASLTPKDKWGNTALGWALKKGNTPTAALLRKAGAL
jgi:ankyrin repeat protein